MKTINAITTLSLLSAAIPAAAQQPEPSDSIQPATYETLDEVVISARKPVIQANGEKISYNVEEDPAADSSSALEMLRKVPSVTIDGQDNIFINGNGNFRIQVNGKDDPSLSMNTGKILKAMPASAIVRFEIIQEPGAKFDAEGAAGILNIITARRQSNDGYAGSLSIGAGRTQLTPSAYIRAKKGKFSGNAHVEYAGNPFANQTNDSDERIEYLTDMNNHLSRLSAKQQFGFHYIGGGIDLAFEPDSLNLITANMNVRGMDGFIRKYDETNRMFDSEGNLRWGYDRKADNGGLTNFGLSAGMSYQHTFRRRGHHIILSYLYSRGNDKLDVTRRFTETINFQSPEYSYFCMDNTTNEHTVQLDYALPLSDERHIIETGAKTVFRRNDGSGHESYGDSKENLSVDEPTATDMRQFQDIAAAYASYTGSLGKWSLKAGVRYEHTRMGINFRKGDYDDFTTHLNDVVPNAAVSYSFAPAHSLRASYQMRITRPSLSQVNPARIPLSVNNVQFGNPDLDSEHNNKVTLTYSNFGRMIGGNLSLEYSQTDNSIEHYVYSDGITIFSTSANLGKNRATTLSGFLNCNFSAKTRLTINGNVQYVDIKAPDPSSDGSISANGWTGYIGGSFDWTMPAAIRLNAYGGKSFGNIGLYSSSNGWYYYGISLSRSFLKNDALTVALNAGNFLESSRSFKHRQHTASTITHSEYRNHDWNIGVSLSWNFGSLKSQTKKTDASISNDDQSQGGQSKGLGF